MDFLCEYHQTIKVEQDYDYSHLFSACFISADTMIFAVQNLCNIASQVSKVTNKVQLQERHLNMVQQHNAPRHLKLSVI